MAVNDCQTESEMVGHLRNSEQVEVKLLVPDTVPEWFSPPAEPLQPSPPPVEPPMTDEEARQIFVLFDADSSGTVEIDELVVFVKAIKGTNHVNPAAITEVWDQDNSGGVTTPAAVAVRAAVLRVAVSGGSERVHSTAAPDRHQKACMGTEDPCGGGRFSFETRTRTRTRGTFDR